MFLQISKIQLFVILLILPLSTAYYSYYEIADCEYGTEEYTIDSIYQGNLNLLLSSLSKSTPINGYFEDSIESSGINKVFGHGMCRGDLDLPDGCSECLEIVASTISELCPYKKNAGLMHDKCFLRYGNLNFFGKPTGGKIVYYKLDNITTDREQFTKVREQLFSKLLVEATNKTSSPPFFAAGEAFVSSNLSVFALLQCTRDLSIADCNTCLKEIIGFIPIYSTYSIGAMFVDQSCFTIHSNEIFYNKLSPPPPSLPPPSPPSPPSLLSPPPPPPPPTSEAKGSSMSTEKIVMIASISGLGLLMIMFILGFYLLRKKKRQQQRMSDNELRREFPPIIHFSDANRGKDGSFQKLSSEKKIKNQRSSNITTFEHLSLSFLDLDRATKHFSPNNMVGEGSFGYVYKGNLNGRQIAVKRLTIKDSLQGEPQLEKEVILLAGLQHKNLCRIVGYCIEEDEMLLVYDYMPNGSLDKKLFDCSLSKGTLTWTTRLNIIEGIIKGIQYLHEDHERKVFHRDLKPENIMLNEEMTPKISDFGISKFFDATHTHATKTENNVGTWGYMAPEYRLCGHFSIECDIYSLGVILLEIVTGVRWSGHNNSRPDSNNLRNYIKTNLGEKIDKNVGEACTVEQEKILSDILRIAMLCVEYDPDLNPQYPTFVIISNFQIIPLSKCLKHPDPTGE